MEQGSDNVLGCSGQWNLSAVNLTSGKFTFVLKIIAIVIAMSQKLSRHVQNNLIYLLLI